MKAPVLFEFFSGYLCIAKIYLPQICKEAGIPAKEIKLCQHQKHKKLLVVDCFEE